MSVLQESNLLSRDSKTELQPPAPKYRRILNHLMAHPGELLSGQELMAPLGGDGQAVVRVEAGFAQEVVPEHLLADCRERCHPGSRIFSLPRAGIVFWPFPRPPESFSQMGVSLWSSLEEEMVGKVIEKISVLADPAGNIKYSEDFLSLFDKVVVERGDLLRPVLAGNSRRVLAYLVNHQGFGLVESLASEALGMNDLELKCERRMNFRTVNLTMARLRRIFRKEGVKRSVYPVIWGDNRGYILARNLQPGESISLPTWVERDFSHLPPSQREALLLVFQQGKYCAKGTVILAETLHPLTFIALRFLSLRYGQLCSIEEIGRAVYRRGYASVKTDAQRVKELTVRLRRFFDGKTIDLEVYAVGTQDENLGYLLSEPFPQGQIAHAPIVSEREVLDFPAAVKGEIMAIANQVQVEGTHLETTLSSLERRMLFFLAFHFGKPCSNTALLRNLWGQGYFRSDSDDIGRVYDCISGLRRKLKGTSLSIAIYRNRGYSLKRKEI